MKPHDIYPSEITYSDDRVTGARVKKLTGWLGHSTHPYFTDDGFFMGPDGREQMLFVSDRGNARNLHCVDIESGEIWRLSDLPAGQGLPAFPMAVNHIRNETYYQFNGKVYAISLNTLETRHLFDVPEGYTFGGLRPMADGKYAVGGLKEDTKNVKANLSAGYIGMKDVFMAKPHCIIIKVDVETGKYDEVYSENSWTGHVNPSPVIANLITYCHEGPWELVDHRIWLLDTDTGKKARLRERRVDGEMIGHEYWFLDGEHVGYQVHSPGEKNSRDTWFGFVKYDGTGEIEAPCVALPSPDHVHSNGFDLVVSDSGKHIKGYWNEGEKFSSPRIICMHDGSFDWGGHHPHPRLTKDGKSVVFNSTAAGYCNVYIAPIPEDYKDLPVAVAGKSY